MSRRVVARCIAALVMGLVAAGGFAQGSKGLGATVIADGKQPVVVEDLQLDFRRDRSGWYNPSEYGKQRAIPLDNGIKVPLDRAAEIKFSTRVDSGKAKAIVRVTVTTATGQKVESALAGPESSAVYLIGSTELGSFELRLNPYESRDIAVSIRR